MEENKPTLEERRVRKRSVSSVTLIYNFLRTFRRNQSSLSAVEKGAQAEIKRSDMAVLTEPGAIDASGLVRDVLSQNGWLRETGTRIRSDRPTMMRTELGIS